MRHGLTLGELAKWFLRELRLDLECEVVAMEGWNPARAPGYGWPVGERTWVNPSPNAPNPWMARCYAGTVMLKEAPRCRRAAGRPGRSSYWGRPISSRVR